MRARSAAVKKLGIVFHPHNEAAGRLAGELREFLAGQGADVWLCSAWDGQEARRLVDGTELLISIGGDGTILRAAQAVVPRRVPITGINLGSLGFMTELTAAEARSQLARLLAGEGWDDERALLEARLRPPGAGQEQTFYALNDVVISHGGVARLLRIEARIDGELLTTYKADGVIVSTATGSTGYALAAGGSILPPQSREMLLLPILPHLSATHRLVLAPGTVIGLRVGVLHAASMTVDGHISAPTPDGTEVTVRLSQHTICFRRIHAGTTFYGSLEKRLKGKQG